MNSAFPSWCEMLLLLPWNRNWVSCIFIVVWSQPPILCLDDMKWYQELGMKWLSVTLFKVYVFIFERGRASGGGAGKEGERIPSRLRAASADPDVGLELTDCEIMTWAKSQTLSGLSHPGAPKLYSIQKADNLCDKVCPCVICPQFYKISTHTQTYVRKVKKKLKILVTPNSVWIKR